MCSFKPVFHEYDPNFTAASLDEAYLDITNVCKERDITGGEVSKSRFKLDHYSFYLRN